MNQYALYTDVKKKEATMEEYEVAKQKVIDALQKKQDSKSKHYFNDLQKILELKPRDAKKIVNQMVEEGILEYWSSGSTTMYGLKGTGKQAAAEHEA
jgi:Mn-dependent DtxR family transcriptional regulator